MPTNLDWALDKSDEQPSSKDPSLRALAERLVQDGLLLRADGRKPNARAWVQPKSSEKCNLIDLIFTKLDIFNMFWSCRMPEEYQQSVRIGVAERVYSFPSLPFGCLGSVHSRRRNWRERYSK